MLPGNLKQTSRFVCLYCTL